MKDKVLHHSNNYLNYFSNNCHGLDGTIGSAGVSYNLKVVSWILTQGKYLFFLYHVLLFFLNVEHIQQVQVKSQENATPQVCLWR